MKAKTKSKIYAAILLAFLMLWAFLTLFFTPTVYMLSESLLISHIVLLFAVLIFLIGRIYLNQLIVRLTLAKGELDVFRDTLRYVGTNNPRNVMFLAAECDAGNYAYVISCCAKQLQQKRNNKMHRYHCLHMLAHCYYELGDDQKLDAVCRAFEDMLAKEKNPAPIATAFDIMRYYRAFLDKDVKRCYAFIEKEQKIKALSHEYEKKFHRARIAQDILGDMEQAQALYLQAAQGPADFAFVRYSAVGVDYRKEFGEVLPDPDVSLKVSKEHKILNAIVLPLVLCVAIVCAVLYVSNIDKILAWGDVAQIRLELGKKGYDEVEHIGYLSIEQDGTTLESVYVCAADGEIVLVGSYVLDRNATRAFYRVLGSVPAEQVSDANAEIKPLTVMGAAENLLITFGFYRAEQQIPQDAKYVIALPTGGNTLYVAVLEYMQSME